MMHPQQQRIFKSVSLSFTNIPRAEGQGHNAVHAMMTTDEMALNNSYMTGNAACENVFCACAGLSLSFRHSSEKRQDGPSAALLESPEKIRSGIPLLPSVFKQTWLDP
ncbi:hypothetical protein AMECASPLE_001665 [Ameca splendens]|uniref:Uncharacterized protein n=1 Tax=Ameca splendens TaxID=208324 RepID=A0ABV0ZTX2_9TELE